MLPEDRSKMNSDPGDLPPQLQSLEAALAALVPRAERLDRDRLMFEAGRESVLKSASRGRWAWPALSTAMTALAGALLVMLVLRPEPRVVERIVYVRANGAAEGLAHDSLRPTAGEGNDKAPGLRIAPRDTPRLPASEGAVASAAPQHPSSETPYLELRDQILQNGIDAWRPPVLSMSTPAPGPASPPTYTELRDELLNRSSSQSWIQ